MKGLLPLLPIVALGAATGGFGLLGAGAAAAGAAGGAAAGGAAAAGVMPVAGGLTNVAAGTAAAGAGGGLFGVNNLLLASSALAGVGSILGGGAEAAALEQQAQAAELQQANERLEAETSEAQRQQELRRVLAMQRTAFGARGVDVGLGTPLTLAGDTIRTSNESAMVQRSLTGARLASLGLQRDSLRSQAGTARMGGYAGAAGSILDFGIARQRLRIA